MRVLLLGSTGTIGLATLEALVAQGHRVVCLVRPGRDGKVHADLVKKILEYSSKKNDIVLDPFLGSGQVAMIAKQLNRKYVGFEIVKKYHDFAKKRLEKNLYRVKA